MKSSLRVLLIIMLATVYGCKSAQQSTQNAKVDNNGVMDITLTDMNKDAVRLRGQIMKSNGLVNKRHSYDFKVEEVMQYGATFSSAEPKVGEVLNLITPVKATFDEGQVVIIDVLTPKFNREAGKMRVRLGQP